MNPTALQPLILTVLIMGIFFFIVILPARRQRQKIETFRSAIKAGDKVITVGGIYGTVSKVEEQTLMLQIANNVRVEVARSAIVGYQGQPPVADNQQ